MATEFQGPYQSLYEAGRGRLRASEARRRAFSLADTARRGITTSGVSQLPQDEITRTYAQEERELESDISGRQEAERLADKRFGQQKELIGLQASLAEAAERRRRKYSDRDALFGLGSSAIGGGTGALTSYLLKR
jgi:hypothetical protein